MIQHVTVAIQSRILIAETGQLSGVRGAAAGNFEDIFHRNIGVALDTLPEKASCSSNWPIRRSVTKSGKTRYSGEN